MIYDPHRETTIGSTDVNGRQRQHEVLGPVGPGDILVADSLSSASSHSRRRSDPRMRISYRRRAMCRRGRPMAGTAWPNGTSRFWNSDDLTRDPSGGIWWQLATDSRECRTVTRTKPTDQCTNGACFQSTLNSAQFSASLYQHGTNCSHAYARVTDRPYTQPVGYTHSIDKPYRLPHGSGANERII